MKRGERILGPYADRDKWRVIEVDALGGRSSTVFDSEAKAQRYKELLLAELDKEERTTSTALVEYKRHLGEKGTQQQSIDVTARAIDQFFVDAIPLQLLSAKRCAALYEALRFRPMKCKRHLECTCIGKPPAVDTHLYIAFREATCGKQWISGLGDAMAELGVHDEDADAYLERLARRRAAVLAAAGTPLPDLLPLDLHIRGYLYPAALKVGWETVFALCDAEAEAATSELDVQRALDRFLWSQLGSRASPSSVAEENPCC